LQALILALACLAAETPAAPQKQAAAPEPTALGKPLSHWARALNDKKSRDRKNAPLALATIGAPAVPALKKGLSSQDAFVRVGAAFALGRIGREAKAAVPALFKALDDDDRNVRALSASALAAIGERSADLVRAMEQWIESPDPILRMTGFGVLGRLGPAAQSAAPALRKQLGSRDPGVRAAAEEALKKIEPAPARRP
jgi:HEAT repeat protein